MKTRWLTCLLLGSLWFPSNAAADWGPAQLAGNSISPGEKARFYFGGERSFEGAFIDFAVLVARGARPGPTLCVTSAVHGDEVNSVEIVRRVFAAADAEQLSGMLVVLPTVNSYGFRAKQRNMPDRRDLNRAFPGNLNGSVATIVAHEVFEGVIKHCSYLIDLHTGSNLRTNMPQVRVDTTSPEALDLAMSFGVGIVIAGVGPEGSLRRESARRGIPAITYEGGGPYIFSEPEIVRGVKGVKNALSFLEMTPSTGPGERAKVLERSRWLRVPHRQGGIYLPVVALGDRVEAGQLVATVTDPVTDRVNEVRADEPGVVIGMALPQVVLSGFALIHVGKLN